MNFANLPAFLKRIQLLFTYNVTVKPSKLIALCYKCWDVLPIKIQLVGPRGCQPLCPLIGDGSQSNRANSQLGNVWKGGDTSDVPGCQIPGRTSHLLSPICGRPARCFKNAYDRVRRAKKRAARVQRKCYDEKSRQTKFREGQMVWLFWPQPSIWQRFKKLRILWTGPWKIEEFQSPKNSAHHKVIATNCSRRSTTSLFDTIGCWSACRRFYSRLVCGKGTTVTSWTIITTRRTCRRHSRHWFTVDRLDSIFDTSDPNTKTFTRAQVVRSRTES